MSLSSFSKLLASFLCRPSDPPSSLKPVDRIPSPLFLLSQFMFSSLPSHPSPFRCVCVCGRRGLSPSAHLNNTFFVSFNHIKSCSGAFSPRTAHSPFCVDPYAPSPPLIRPSRPSERRHEIQDESGAGVSGRSGLRVKRSDQQQQQ